MMKLLFLVSFLIACSPERLPAIPAGSTVLILGDSLSYGTGANEHQDYPTLLAQTTAWHIVNAGVPGDTSAQGLARLPTLLENYQPKLLMVVLGGNDFFQRTPIEQTKRNLKTIIQTARQKNILTLLVAIPDFKPMKAALIGLSDHPLYAALAKEEQIPLIKDAFTTVLSKNALKADYVHPNALGYRKVEAQIRESLTDLGLLDVK